MNELDVWVREELARPGDRCARTYCRELLAGPKGVAHLSDGRKLDLCPACTRDFVEWLEEKSPTGRAN